MTEQQTRNRRQNADSSQRQVAGASDARARKAHDDRCEAVRRWIDDDDDSCCRGID
jgi:hypothetical protein